MMNSKRQLCPKCQGLGNINLHDRDNAVLDKENSSDKQINCAMCSGKGTIETTDKTVSPHTFGTGEIKRG